MKTNGKISHHQLNPLFIASNPRQAWNRVRHGIKWRVQNRWSQCRSLILSLSRSYLQRQGYGVYRIASLDVAAALTVKESKYYTQWCAPCPLFSPWSGHPDFQKLYEGVAGYSLVSPERCYTLAGLAAYAVHLDGDFSECGVYRGGTALLLCKVLQNSSKTLHLFDSFQGLPQENKEHDHYYTQGALAVESVDSVRKLFNDYENSIDIRPGWIPETFLGLEHKRFAFAHIDVDQYQSALDCCTFFYPRLVPGGVLLFDDYGFPAARGEKDAVDEFFADKQESPITLPTGQALVLKLPSANARQ